MIRLNKSQGEVIRALAVLSLGDQQWLSTEQILQERMGDREFNHDSYFKSTEGLLERLCKLVPQLVERRLGASGFSWKLTVAGKAVAETQLGVKNETELRT